MFKRITVATILAVGLITPTAIGASATEYKGGYRSCAGVGDQQVATRGKTKGTVTHIQNGVGLTFGYSTNWWVTVWNAGYRTANWQVSGTVDLDGAGTYAYCPA